MLRKTDGVEANRRSSELWVYDWKAAISTRELRGDTDWVSIP